MSNAAIFNPFVTKTTETDAFASRESTESGESEYAIVRREGAAPVEGVEHANVEVVEVQVRWGRTVLGVAHVAREASLKVGEVDGGSIVIPEEIVGARSFTLVEGG